MPNKIIIGLVGEIASGKGTATTYLREKHGATTHRFSTILRDIVDRIYVPQSRENLQTLSRILRENFGEDILAKSMADDAKNDESNLIVIDGVRRPDDVKYLKKIPGFVLVHIFADMEKRYERITARGENTDDTKKTFEQFEKDHEGEAELKIAEIAAQATEEIDNNRTLDKLYSQLDDLMKRYAA